MFLNLTDEQKAILLTIHTNKCQDQLAARFSDPALDGKTIRSLIHMQGEAEMINYLLSFDGMVLEQAEAAKQQLLASNEE